MSHSSLGDGLNLGNAASFQIGDYFMVAADFDAYWHTQRAIDALWRDPGAWWKASIASTARTGWFSSDRAIRAYAREIWGVRTEP